MADPQLLISIRGQHFVESLKEPLKKVIVPLQAVYKNLVILDKVDDLFKRHIKLAV
jgi:hypothetical protein